MQKSLKALFIFLLPLILTASCRSVNSNPYLYFDQNGCRYEGPSTLMPQFSMTWVIEDNTHDAFIYAVVQLKDNKTIKDLAVMPAEEPPPDWVQKLGYALEFDPCTSTQRFNLENIYRFDPHQPIYIVCFFTNEYNAIGAAGPIMIASERLR